MTLHLVDFVLNFYLYLVPLFYFLKWNRYFSFYENMPSFASIFSAIKHNSFVLLECSGQNLSNFPCQFWNDKSVSCSNFASFFIVVTHNSSVNFRIPSKIPMEIFESFEYSGQNPPNSWHFWNNKSFFKKILHHSSVSWHITFLCFLAEILYTFSKSSLSKYKFGEISRKQSKFWNFSLW